MYPAAQRAPVHIELRGGLGAGTNSMNGAVDCANSLRIIGNSLSGTLKLARNVSQFFARKKPGSFRPAFGRDFETFLNFQLVGRAGGGAVF